METRAPEADALPYATADIAGTRGVMKTFREDFEVEEIPAYEPSGEGDHVYFGIEKAGLTTMQALASIARALDVKRRDIGCAGMKDARGVTRQTLSLEHGDPDRIQALEIPNLKILWVSRHRNKLKTGHLRGNRFILKIREVEDDKLERVRTVMELLATKGAPNYFGHQRFGARGDTWKVGMALLAGDYRRAVSIVCGEPGPLDEGRVLEARQLFEAGDMAAAASAWPRGYRDSSDMCRSLERHPDDWERAIMRRDRKLLGLYVSALQSHLFNRVLAARIGELDTVHEGDLAWKHVNGAVFQVEDPSVEDIRAKAGEISPSGPMFGKRMTAPKGRAAQIEGAVLSEAGLTIESFPSGGPLGCAGGRRPLRFFPKNPEVSSGEDENGGFVRLAFGLDSGCYATEVLREIFKEGLVRG